MDSKVDEYLSRSGNEFRLAKALKIISESLEEKDRLKLNREDTFYSSVISHSYYCIFYAAKASLLSKNIETKSPEVHKKTFGEFDRVFVKSGELDLELLKIYKKMLIRADELLFLFKEEKSKRGKFTYQTIPQANIEPAEESINNAEKFLTNIKNVIEK